MIGYIYLITNLVNGKKYIGKRQSGVFDVRYKGSGKHLRNAIDKYGWDNFSCEVLEWCETVEDLVNAEKRYIAESNAQKSDEYYNIAAGGDGGDTGHSYPGMPGHVQTEEEKLKRSISLKKAYAENRHKVVKAGYPKGKKRSEADRKANSERNKNKTWVNNGVEQHTIPLKKLNEYLAKGWINKKLPTNKPVWNKGKTKETDLRLLKMSNDRKEKMKDEGPIGCFGLKGQDNKNSKTNRQKKLNKN